MGQAMVLWFAAAFFAGRILFAPGPELVAAWRRLERVRPSLQQNLTPEQQEMAAPLAERLFTPLLRAVGDRLYRLTPAGVRGRFTTRLTRAGQRGQVVRFMGLMGLCALAGPVTLVLARAPLPRAVPCALLLALMGMLLPDFWLSRRIRARSGELRRHLPDVLDLLCVSVEAGLAFDGAMHKVAEKFKGPLGEEFETYLREVRLGRSRADALRGIAERSDLPELRSFTAALVQADQLGVPIAGVLRVQADQIRLARRQRIEEEAMKIPIKLLFPMVIFIFPAIFAVLLGPAVISYMEVLGK
ncbi:MAG: type II secretion system F family protein [Bacillota bacterium]